VFVWSKYKIKNIPNKNAKITMMKKKTKSTLIKSEADIVLVDKQDYR